MTTSLFAFLQAEWPAVHDSALKAAAAVHSDPRTACFYARRTLEIAVGWIYKWDRSLQLPYQDNLSALIHEPTFKKAAGDAVFNKARVINQLGNLAVHGHRPVPPTDALAAVKELFHFTYWLAHTYARGARPSPTLTFDAAALPKSAAVDKQTQDQLRSLEASLREKDEKLSEAVAGHASLTEEIKRLQAEIAEAKKQSAAQPDTHDYSEAETRDRLIDGLLKEAGWALDQKQDIEFEVSGMPNNQGKGYVDYVLWGEDGKPLALVEAKRTRRDPRVGQQQAKLYADCLEQAYGQRPVIFYSNGYEHWFWDDALYPPRPVQGFYKRDELALLMQRRTSRKRLAEAGISGAIVERYYQTRAIRRIAESFERDHLRKALVVMATGAGKTRTVIALADLLMRCNWAKRVLFLADRVALVNQAVKAFKTHLPDSSPVNLVTEKDTEGRVYVSTYPTMMGLINDTSDGLRRFGVGHFDLIVIDEAHRSVFQKYKAIFDYFDSLLVGLTATPKDELDRNSYRLFDLEDGVPTDAYSLDEAVRDGYLVPPTTVSVPLKFQRDGIKYDELSEAEQEQWDDLEWEEEGEPPDAVDAQAVNKWLFNQDTVDKVLKHLMQNGIKVAGGDLLGKTILFAKNQAHADFIAERFDVNYPHLRGQFARVITFKTEYAQSLIDAFSKSGKPPHLALSVDMLDTGIDVPEVVNLVFFKLVRSKTKFWQMIGRGTRLCPDLFGPGRHKSEFKVFDFCQNLEYFSFNPKAANSSVPESLGTRLFKGRLELIRELDDRLTQVAEKAPDLGPARSKDDAESELDVRRHTASLLQGEVAAMNVDNFIVRPKRKWVEKYASPQAWTYLAGEAYTELSHEVAGLPSELESESEDAKRFDLLLLRVQLALLRSEPGFERLRDQVKSIAGLLEEKSSIPAVAPHLALIQDLQTEEWWQDVTTPMLETVRRRLRGLVHLLEKAHRPTLYTDFQDEMGEGAVIELPGITADGDFEKFRLKARAFLLGHQDHIVIHKLRFGKALTPTDLDELEKILIANGVGASGLVHQAKQESEGLGLFVRSLIGLDRGAAKEALNGFTAGRDLSSNQVEFLNLIVNHLTDNGAMTAAQLYESPFTDIAPQGPEALFTPADIDRLVVILDKLKASAQAA